MQNHMKSKKIMIACTVTRILFCLIAQVNCTSFIIITKNQIANKS